MTGLVGALLGACAIVFGVIAILKPGALRRRFDGRESWMVVKDKERDFEPRATQLGGVVFGLAGVVLIVLSVLGVFG